MKKISFATFWLLAAMLLSAQLIYAQNIHGTATITVQKKNGATVTYHYPDDFPGTLYNCTQKGGPAGSQTSYLDFGFSRTFSQFKNADGDPPIVSVQIRVGPGKTGTFPLKEPDSQKPHASLDIDLNAPAGPLLSAIYDGTGGDVTISEYPLLAGSYVTGSFKATLKDAAGISYLVNGNFKVMRQSDDE